MVLNLQHHKDSEWLNALEVIWDSKNRSHSCNFGFEGSITWRPKLETLEHFGTSLFCGSVTLFVAHRRGAGCAPQQEEGHDHWSHYVHTRWDIRPSHTVGFFFVEKGHDVNAACLCGQHGQPYCRWKPKQTLRHCDLISTSEELYALTPASHYTSKKELGRKTNACVKMHSWKWEGWKSVNSKYHGAENNPEEPFVSYFLSFVCETSILTTWIMECSSSKDFLKIYIMLTKVQTNNSTLLAQPLFLLFPTLNCCKQKLAKNMNSIKCERKICHKQNYM